ncbi:MAG: hypothetical protein GIKADHBN_02443 [Phycisphaerales bacterium]|nr:hypothetical protein [Phycisphaerales bacterium]
MHVLARTALFALMAGVSTSVHATLVNFDDGWTNNTVIDTQYAGVGVTFSSPETFVAIRDMTTLGSGYNTTSFPNAAFAAFDGDVQGTLRIDFAAPASSVSFFAIDVGDSSRDAKAYDSFNNLLETITVHNPGTGPGIGIIDPVVFTVSGIAYVTFGQGAVYIHGDGSLIDDLSFVIPAPGSAAVVAAGIFGIARRRRAPACVSS